MACDVWEDDSFYLKRVTYPGKFRRGFRYFHKGGWLKDGLCCGYIVIEK